MRWAHAQKPDFVFRRNRLVHLTLYLLMWGIWWAPNNASRWQMEFNMLFKGLNRRGRQFSRLLAAAEVCASAVVMLDTACSEVVWRVLATHSIRHFPFQFPSRASPCAITFQLASTDPTRSVVVDLCRSFNMHLFQTLRHFICETVPTKRFHYNQITRRQHLLRGN